MPLCGLMVALFVGWVMKRQHVAEEIALSTAGLALWYHVLRFVCPLAIALIFANAVGWLG